MSFVKTGLVLFFLTCKVYAGFAEQTWTDSTTYYCREADKIISSDPGRATEYAKRTLELVKQHPNPHNEATAYKILGIVSYYAGNFTEALSWYLKGLEKAESQNHAGACSMLLNEIGTLYKKQGDLDKSEKTFMQALQFARQQPDSAQIANSQNNLGVVYEMKKDYSRALSLYKESAEIKKRMGDETGLSYNLANIGSVLGQMHQYAEAEKYILASSEIREKIKDTKGLGINYTLLGEMYALKGDFAPALKYFFLSLDKAREAAYKDLENFNYKEISKIYEKQGNYKQAHEFNEKHIAIKDSLFNVQRASQLLEMETKYQAEKKEKLVAEQKTALAESELLIKRRNNTIIIVSSIALLILAVGLMLFLQQRTKARQLKKEAALKQKLAEAELLNKLQSEKERISRDLHDHIGSQLTLITTSLDNLAYRMNGSSELTPHIENIGGQARDTMAQLRETIWAMNKESISVEMLLSKIREFAQRSTPALGDNKKIEVRLSGDGKTLLSPSKSLALFRVCQEAINNAIKHADFTEMQILLSADNGTVTMRIDDNGKGFDKEEAASRGYGLENMAYRIEEAGGVFSLETAPGAGTKIGMEIAV